MAIVTTRKPTVTRCPVCGGLECLCRPRFFAGQLLTEDDLNRLERYIIDKNKLHNRYLHGWGVVCGLEVICNPCKGFVTVRSGYALSPCGDDIVICRDEAVNVCELIQECQQKDWECDPAWPRPDPICGEKDEPWILYLCYDEKSSRGITPLKGASGGACCSSCSCGGSSSCGCGCGNGNGSGSSGGCGCGGTKRTAAKYGGSYVQTKAPPQCEPTVTCEGYTFKLRKERKLEESDLGEWFNRIRECIRDLAKLQQATNGLPNSNQPAIQVSAIKSALTEWMERHAIYNCDLYQQIIRIELPPSDPAAPPNVGVTQQNLTLIIRELFRECVCSTLLPPCPQPADENCVPIATLTLNCKAGCRVVRICNLENRRMVITFPILQYFLGGIVKQLKMDELLARLCCRPLPEPQTPGVILGPAPGQQGDFLDAIFADAVEGKLNSQTLVQRLAPLAKEIPARFRA